MEMTFQLLEQLSHKPRLLVGLGIVLWTCAYYYNKKVLSPFQYSVFAFKPILFCTMVLLFLALLLWGNQTSKMDLYWLIYIAGTLATIVLYVYNLRKTNWYLAIINVSFQLLLSAVCAAILITISTMLIIRKIFSSEKKKQSYQQKTFN
jgi:hypothetical protein